MNLATTILLAESAIAPTHRHHAVMSPHMRKEGGHTHSEVKREHPTHSGGHGTKGGGVKKSGVKHIHPHLLKVHHAHVHLIHPNFKKLAVTADASASDLASHHTWQEPSASDVTIRRWQGKRMLEKAKRRNLELYEPGALHAEATGPCGCTLKLKERVVVEGVGRGKIQSRDGRMLTVAMDNGRNRTVDQKFVHRML
jgi:hypothetical protein